MELASFERSVIQSCGQSYASHWLFARNQLLHVLLNVFRKFSCGGEVVCMERGGE